MVAIAFSCLRVVQIIHEQKLVRTPQRLFSALGKPVGRRLTSQAWMLLQPQTVVQIAIFTFVEALTRTDFLRPGLTS